MLEGAMDSPQPVSGDANREWTNTRGSESS
jgi:hypothetical protein